MAKLSLSDVLMAVESFKKSEESSECSCNLSGFSTWYCEKHDLLHIDEEQRKLFLIEIFNLTEEDLK